MPASTRRVVLFGDDIGLAQLLRPPLLGRVSALVAAEIRPEQHEKLRRLAGAHHLPLLIQPKFGSAPYPDFIERIRVLDPELIITNSYCMLLRPEILAIPRFGCVNVHGGLLPKYRGANPTQWALLNNEKETGVTMHYMTGEFDAGDIIAQRRVPISFEDTWRDIQERLKAATEALLEEQIPMLLSQKSARVPQDGSIATIHKRRRPEDGVVDWDQSVMFIYNLIRALVAPHPGAFYQHHGERVVLGRYMTVAEVAALKYGIGGRVLASETCEMTPLVLDTVQEVRQWAATNKHGWIDLPGESNDAGESQDAPEERRRRNGSVTLCTRSRRAGEILAVCELGPIDWISGIVGSRIGTARALADPAQLREVIGLLLRFAFLDLELQQVVVPLRAEGALVTQACLALGFRLEGGEKCASPSRGTSLVITREGYVSA